MRFVRKSQFSKVPGREVAAYRGIDNVGYRSLRQRVARKCPNTAVSHLLDTAVCIGVSRRKVCGLRYRKSWIPRSLPKLCYCGVLILSKGIQDPVNLETLMREFSEGFMAVLCTVDEECWLLTLDICCD